DQARSAPGCPALTGTSVAPLAGGERVPVDIALCPASCFFSAGETLRLIVAPSDLVHAPVFKKDTRLNSGRHVLHMGGDYDAHLLLPVIDASSEDGPNVSNTGTPE
ncbi:MAG: CocE/NonD family hydrolase C-terminal non-catalytic domain-containing protein, partial [Pseudomonadota bacterium]